ncbi:MAG: ROK family protein [Ktedonobacterales bacterium]
MAVHVAAGVDVGGTKIYAGVVNLETGEVLATARKRTHPERGVDFFTQRLQEVIAAALDSASQTGATELLGVGIGIAGQVDRERGIVLGAPNLATGLVNLDVATLLSGRFGAPVALGNDVEVAALGEQHFGAGRGLDDFVYVSVGTGVGGAIVQDGLIYRGQTGFAGEIGHTIVQYNGRYCGCGGRGHLEAYASRTAITKELFAEMARGRPSKLQELLKPGDIAIRSKMLARCAEEGDELVLEALAEAADYLGAGLGSLASFYNPRRCIVGGGLVEAIPSFMERASLRAREVALPISGRAMEVVKSALGDNSGIVGAAWLGGNLPPPRRD